MSRWISIMLLFAIAGCTSGQGTRCNPNRATSDCDPGLSCVFPATPGCNPSEPGTDCCGVSYCCKTDSTGAITDSNPNCAPDPNSVAACGFDRD